MPNKQAGVYKIENTVTKKVYIGSTKRLSSREKDHWKALRLHKHVNPHLQYAWNKYGEESFVFQTLEVVDDLATLNEVESRYIALFHSNEQKHGYNLVPPRGSHLVSEEWREKLRHRKKRAYFPMSEETKKATGNANRGKEPWNKGQSFPPENHPMFGKKQPKSTKDKISVSVSASLRDLWADEDYRKKMTETRKGDRNGMSNKNRSEEMKKHMREINLGSNNPMFGKHPSKETRKKSSESHKLAWARRKAQKHS